MTIATISEFRANVKRYVDDVINYFFDDTKLINENLQKDEVEKDVDRKKDDEGELGHIAEE